MKDFNYPNELTQKRIFRFWVPLASTWLMMSAEGPYLSALIARLAEPEYNLAAYGIALSLAMIVEAPIIMMMSASTALAKDYSSFRQLKKFNFALSAMLTLIISLFNIPVVFYFVTEGLIGLPENVAQLAHLSVIIMIPWPGAIGYRRFYQGILIRNNSTRLVAYGTVIRLVSMSLTALILYLSSHMPGAAVGAASLSAGVVCEAIASRIMCSKILRQMKAGMVSAENSLSQKEIFKFYYPLALTSLINIGIQPFITFFIGHSRMAIESFAVLPVVTSFVFIFRALGISFQEVVIALGGDDYSGIPFLKRFAARLAVFSAGLLMLIAFTPLSVIWFRDVSGLSDRLTEFARLPLIIMSLFPALTVLTSFQWGIIVKSSDTRKITFGTAVEFTGIFLIAAVSIQTFQFTGAVAATSAFLLGRIAACTYLISPAAKPLKPHGIKLF